jgi:hypothetical protein
MQRLFVAIPALLFAACAAAQGDGRANPLDAGAKTPPVEYRSAFEGYKPFAEQELTDWRKSNAEVDAASRKASKPAPGKPATKQGHGAHK